MVAIFLVLETVFIIGIYSVLNGWVLTILWNWFIIPVFHLPQLTIVQAIGVVMVIGYLTKEVDINKEEKGTPKERLWKSLGVASIETIYSFILGLDCNIIYVTRGKRLVKLTNVQ
jgi:putative Mn2+ efflux pump MntP